MPVSKKMKPQPKSLMADETAVTAAKLKGDGIALRAGRRNIVVVTGTKSTAKQGAKTRG